MAAGRDDVVGRDDVDLHVAAVFCDERVTRHGAGVVGQAMGISRRRSPTSPAAASATALAVSQTRGVAETGPPGALGMCVNGEMSRSHWFSCMAAPTRRNTRQTA